MTKQEKTVILLALSALSDKLSIKESELISTDKQNKKLEKVLEENEGVFKDKDGLKQEVVKLVNKYINKLSDIKEKKK